MKNNLILGISLCIFTLAGCSRETRIQDTDLVALQVNGGIQTKAIDNAWEPNDAIGIYMVSPGTATVIEGTDNRKYTTANGNSAFNATADQTIYFPVYGNNVDFIAYYPQQSLPNGSMTIDVSTQTSLPSIDLMSAKAESTDLEPYNKSNPSVAFKFYHKLTKLELNIVNGTGLTPENLEDLKVEITNQRTVASYTPLTETLTIESDQLGQTVTFNTIQDGTTAQAILLPNSTLNQIIAGRELVFTLQTGEVFRWSIPQGKDFLAGERNIYNITIHRSGLIVTATIENWNYGNGDHGESGDAE